MLEQERTESMLLSPGTALQQGHYVIDALLEAAPNGDLYLGTHVVTGTPIYIQVLSLNKSVDSAELSDLVACLQGLPFATNSPLPNPLHVFPGEGQTLCLALATTTGVPWTQPLHNQSSLTPKQALARIRAIAQGVVWLKHQGLTDIDLSPNRVWVTETETSPRLTGLPQVHLAPEPRAGESFVPQTTVQGLARLLYSFLLGELPPAVDGEALADTLRKQRPTLSPLIVQAIQAGAAAPSESLPDDGIEQWLAMLPDASHPTPPKPAAAPLALRPAPGASTRQFSWGLYPALGMTALVAAIAGGALGTTWRLQGHQGPGGIQFDPNQSFPPQAEWMGDTPEAAFDAPFVPGGEQPERGEDWLDPEWEAEPLEDEWVPETTSEWLGEPEPSYAPTQDFPRQGESLPSNPKAQGPDREGGDEISPLEEMPTGNPELTPDLPPQTTGKEEVSSNSPNGSSTMAAPIPEVELAPAPAPETTSES